VHYQSIARAFIARAFIARAFIDNHPGGYRMTGTDCVRLQGDLPFNDRAYSGQRGQDHQWIKVVGNGEERR
jgi:hypothetical protein